MGPSVSELRSDEWFEQVYCQTYVRVYQFVARRLADGVADVVAEVYATAWRKRHEVNDLDVPWLLGVAKNILLQNRRSVARRARLTTKLFGLRHESVPDPATSVAQAVRYHDACAAVFDALKPQDAEILRLWGWEQLTPAEIAIVLGISPGNARIKLLRARRQVASILNLSDPQLQSDLKGAAS